MAQNIGNITDASGNFTNAVFVASGSIGDITVTANQGDAISGGSVIAGVNIGDVAAYSRRHRDCRNPDSGGDEQADEIAGVTGISYAVSLFRRSRRASLPPRLPVSTVSTPPRFCPR